MMEVSTPSGELLSNPPHGAIVAVARRVLSAVASVILTRRTGQGLASSSSNGAQLPRPAGPSRRTDIGDGQIEDFFALGTSLQQHLLRLDDWHRFSVGNAAWPFLLGAKRPLLIAITGWGLPEDLRNSTEAGFDKHLQSRLISRRLRKQWLKPCELPRV